jgi:PKD repeat protein
MKPTRTRLTFRILTVAALLTGAASCTLKSQDPPPLTGPSEFGTSITITASPDAINQDGGSQSLITITARDSTGNPLRNLSLRTDIFVGGVHTDFGSLSARSVVTGADGRATLVYTAPASPAGPSVDANTTVNIVATPIGTDFANEVSRLVTIRLLPIGVVVPLDGLQPAFTFSPSSPTDHQPVFFDATTSRAPANNPITAYSWNFGDGSTSSGVTSTHTFNSPGTFVVTLTVTDQFNRTASTSQVIDVGGGPAPVANFTTSPATPRVGEFVNFNASASVPATGRTIRTYTWDFGDGAQKTTTTPTTTHDYETVGTFTVTLTVTDDAGRTGIATAGVTIASDNPTAAFTFTQIPPTSAHTVSFDSSGSSAISGRTITSYFWNFGDGTTSTAASPTHTYAAAATYSVSLTVTDSAGKTGRATNSVAVQ